jgi:hypothetical protein
MHPPRGFLGWESTGRVRWVFRRVCRDLHPHLTRMGNPKTTETQSETSDSLIPSARVADHSGTLMESSAEDLNAPDTSIQFSNTTVDK